MPHTRIALSCLVLLVLAPLTSAENVPTSSSGPEAVVQAQLDAYNAHNIDAFVATYAEDIQLFEHPAKLLASGRSQLRERYVPRFKDPILHCSLVKRIVLGNIVIDEERVVRTFPEGTGVLRAVAIHEVVSDKIAKTWLILGPIALDTK